MAKPNTKPTTPNDDDEDEGTPQFVTVEQLNAAIAGKFSEFTTKKFPKLLEAQFSSLSATLLEGLRGGAGEHVQNPAAGAGQGGAAAPNPEIERLRKESEATKAALKTMEQERAAEQARARKERARGLLTAGLTAAKVHPKLLDAATRLLEDNLAEEEDGRIVFKRMNAYGLQEAVTVEDGVKGWAKSEDGKAFVIAPSTKGSGSPPRMTPGKPTKPAGGKERAAEPDAKDDDLARAKRVLAQEFLGLMSEDGDGDDD
jgi:hypothetical protein